MFFYYFLIEYFKLFASYVIISSFIVYILDISYRLFYIFYIKHLLKK
jgi:hypothetical protein